MNKIKVVSWNVNSIRARIELFVKWIKTNNPDIILLQEIKAREEDFPFSEFDNLNYNIKVNGQKSYNGVAIFSKFPLSDIQINLPTFDDPQARYIEAWVDYKDTGFRVASVYAPNGNPINSDKFNYKLQWLNNFHKHIIKLKEYEESIILGGDYNICPTKDDVANEDMILNDAVYQEDSINLFRKICNVGFFDGFRSLHNKNNSGFTYWDYGHAYQSNLGIRIDHFLLSSYALDKLDNVYVDETPRKQKKTSDHAPIIADFTF